MSVTVTQELTQQTVTVTGNPVENNVTVTVSNARGPAGPNVVNAATTSDGTANLSLAAATVSGTLTASHIHGNLAGSVYAHVRAGEALLKGDPVYVSGSHGSGSTLIAIVSKADASNAAKMPAVGIMDANLAHNATGHMVITGTITELATNAYSINAELYVAAGGGMTATPPTARAQPVARVERSNANNGAIIVKVNELSASDATASTLVRRDANGNASFGQIFSFSLTVTGGTTFGEESLIQFDAVEYYYGDGAASAHRIALGAGTTGATLFGAADAGAARAALGLATTDSVTFAAATMSGLTGPSGLVEMKSGTTWQNLRLYSTTDNATNYEYITVTQSGASWRIGNNKLGTGPTRAIALVAQGSVQLGSNGGDGWSVNTSKHFLPDGTTNTRDLGQATSRIRNLYVGTLIDCTGNITASGTLAVTGATTLSTLVQSPSASATPASNGQLVFEATSNTTITVKYRGSDGTVRSAVLLLT